jgi:hypothetical protein
MVVGNTSKYIEGFESFTADDVILLANLKQAVNYTKANRAISDLGNNRIDRNVTPTVTDVAVSAFGPPKPTTEPVSTKPYVPLATIPIPTIALPTIPIPTGNTGNTGNNATNTTIANKPGITQNTSSFKNISKTNTDDTDDSDDDSANDSSSLPNKINMKTKMNINNINNIKNAIKNSTQNTKSIPTRSNVKTTKSYNSKKNDDSDDDESDVEEGFRGSQVIESDQIKKILLALLITFLGYMLILSSINNLIPINTYAPHLKQFKHFIYGGLFFIIIYICLEVF